MKIVNNVRLCNKCNNYIEFDKEDIYTKEYRDYYIDHFTDSKHYYRREAEFITCCKCKNEILVG